MTKQNKNDGGSAFPISDKDCFWTDAKYKSLCGMTLRDYFAAKALNGMLSRDAHAGGWCPKENPLDCGVKRVARFAYEYADAMLAERDK